MCHKPTGQRTERMMEPCSALGLMIGTLLVVAPVKGDTKVSCVFMKSCILPCSFQSDTDVVVHWTQMKARYLSVNWTQVIAGHLPVNWTQVTARNRSVHSYYDNQDQLKLQDQLFRDRTSLFKDQISRGNASLLLTGVKVRDQGRYQCYTRTISGDKYSFINLTVDAPVGKVKLQWMKNRITCSSEGIYPKPKLTWSTRPPSSVTFKSNTKVKQTQQLLYNINSSLILPRSDSDLSYSCTISTRRNRKTVASSKPRNSTRGLIGRVVAGVTSVLVAVAFLVQRYIKKKGQQRNRETNNDED